MNVCFVSKKEIHIYPLRTNQTWCDWVLDRQGCRVRGTKGDIAFKSHDDSSSMIFYFDELHNNHHSLSFFTPHLFVLSFANMNQISTSAALILD